MQRGPRLDGQDRRAHDLVDGARGQRSESFSLRANIRQERQPPVAPGDTIGVVATDQIAFADHPNQLQVRREHGNGAYALLEQQDRGIAHAGPNQNGNDFLRHDLAGGVRGFDQNRYARFVSHGALSPRRESAAYSTKSSLGLAPRRLPAKAADKTAELSPARIRHGGSHSSIEVRQKVAAD